MLRRFLTLYLVSAFVLLGIIAWFFWHMEYTMQRDLLYSKMRRNAAEISALLIRSHMQKRPLELGSIKADEGFKLGFYDKAGDAIVTQIAHPVNLHRKEYMQNNHIGIVDSSALEHKGVYHVVIEETRFLQHIDTLTLKVLAAFAVLFMLIAAVGYYLARLFIAPIYAEREKRDNFIKDSTHELNTPITALLMSTSAPDLMNEKNIERIRLSARRISELYEDLTYLFLRDKSPKPKESLPLAQIVREQIDYLKPFAERKAITVTTHIEPFDFTIDQESAVRLVNNLLSNAIKYTEKGGNITVTLQNRTLTVEDNGIGIAQEKLDDIFQRYYRATNRNGGFGIGLDMVRTIANDYGIQIEVNSKKGAGTRFALRFPE